MAKSKDVRILATGVLKSARKPASDDHDVWRDKATFATGPVKELQMTVTRTVIEAAKQAGMLHEKTTRISGRVDPELVRRAKARSGITADTDLIEYALASIALEDDFAADFVASRGTVDPDIKLGY